MTILTLCALLCATSQEDVEALKRDAAAKAARIVELQKQLDEAQARSAKQAADLQVFHRQLEVSLETIQKSEDERAARARAEAQAGTPSAAPALAGKVTAVAPETGSAVLSIGKDHGVREGDEFAVRRAGKDVAALVVDRADRAWSAGKVVRGEPARVGDDVLRSAAALSPASAAQLRAIREELDEVRRQVRALSDRLLPSSSESLSVKESHRSSGGCGRAYRDLPKAVFWEVHRLLKLISCMRVAAAAVHPDGGIGAEVGVPCRDAAAGLHAEGGGSGSGDRTGGVFRFRPPGQGTA